MLTRKNHKDREKSAGFGPKSNVYKIRSAKSDVKLAT